MRNPPRSLPRFLRRTIILGLCLLSALFASLASADHTPAPTSVTIAGSLQSELGCPDDWQPPCSETYLTYDADDEVWQATFSVPAGSFEYKAALNGAWDENYGANATPGGANIPLNLAEAGDVKFYYSHQTHWVTSNQNSVIATIPGSFQSELGCPGDWSPDCLRSWLQDPDGDGIYTFITTNIPAGAYEAKVAINESWDENYGAGGEPNGPNIGFAVPSNGTEVYFAYDAVTHILTISVEGAPSGNLAMAQAHWLTRNTIAWNGAITPESIFMLHYAPDGGLTLEPDGVVGGQSLPLLYDPNGMSAELRARFPHLADYKVLKLRQGDLEMVPMILKGQIAISASESDGNIEDATSLQIPGVLDDLYTYNGQLGVSYSDGLPTLRVWAPTAKSVIVHLFDDATTTVSTTLPMYLDAASGTWAVTGTDDWTNKYYLYEVEVFVRSTGQVERNLVTDPYSLSLSMNSTRSQIVDLSDPRLEPQGWDSFTKPTLNAPEDIVLYELHVRDFSVSDPSVPANHRGTYMAFSHRASNGMKHLRNLADYGLTHLHLLPVFDIASINEDPAQVVQPDWDVLDNYPSDSEEQQALINQLRDQDAFNWGYDPYHFGAPEGSYATDPNGAQRIYEFRQMVMSLSEAGLRVVMDVVYNHTSSSGQSEKSVLDKIVPGYYHRLNADGNVETSTCCQNTATEHAMMEKLMVDTLVIWAKYYKVDGFRFDLMGHHMVSNMTRVKEELQSLTMAGDGVDGSNIYIYGEGWNFGEVADSARGVNATQLNVGGLGIGTFNDRLRDAVRGGGPFSGLQEQGFITGLYHDPNATDQGSPDEQRARLLHFGDLIRVGLTGNLADYTLINKDGQQVTGAQVDYNGQPAGYTRDPQEVITYIEAHDNETLFDAIQLKAPLSATLEERVRMQNLGLSIVSLSQGVPFFHAGQDMLRSKSLDRNSYNSGDWFNRLDFTYTTNNWGVGLPPASENQTHWPVMAELLGNPELKPAKAHITQAVMHLWEMLEIRKGSPLFRLETADEIQARLTFLNTGPTQTAGVIVMLLSDTTGVDIDRNYDAILVIFNASDETQTYTHASLQGFAWRLHPVQVASHDARARSAMANGATGSFTVPARTTSVFIVPEGGGAPTSVTVDTLTAATANPTLLPLAATLATILMLGLLVSWRQHRARR